MLFGFLMLFTYKPNQFTRMPLPDTPGADFDPNIPIKYGEDGRGQMDLEAVPRDIKPKVATWRALWDVINLSDVLRGMVRACKLIKNKRKYTHPNEGLNGADGSGRQG